MLYISLACIVGFFALIAYTSKRNKKNTDTLNSYAQAKGWKMGTEAPLVPLFQKQNYRSEPSIMEGEVNGLRWWLYNCYPTGLRSGNQRSSAAVIMLSVEFPITFPDLLIVPNSNMFGTAFDEVAKTTFGLKRLTLEGDFSQHILTYTATGKEVETLQYLPPNVMAEIQDNVKNIVLFSGGYVSVSAETLDGIPTFEGLLHDAQIVTSQIKKKIQLSGA